MKRLPMRVQVAVNVLRGRPVMYRMAVYSDGGIDRAPGRHASMLIAECHLGARPPATIGYAGAWPTREALARLTKAAVWDPFAGPTDQERPG